MNDDTLDSGIATSTRKDGSNARILQPTAAFWLAMFVASALGTNIGDFWADSLGLGLATSFASLAIMCALFIWGDRDNGSRTEIFYWLAVVCLRAVATNIGDFLTHSVGLNFLLAAIVFGALTLVCGVFTRRTTASPSPLIDLRYWGTMGFGGIFGTIAGDLVAHTIGLFLAALLLGALLAVVIRIRELTAPEAITGYWCIVLAERAAGTPMGDWLAKGRGLGLGLPLSMSFVLFALIGILAWRAKTASAASQRSEPMPLFAVLLPATRLGLLILSVVGSAFMLRIYVVQEPTNPALVLTYGLGLAANAFYLAIQELDMKTASGPIRLLHAWWTVKKTESDAWFAAKALALHGTKPETHSVTIAAE